VIFLISIPIISLQFLEATAKTIWVLPLVMIISSFPFRKRTLLISAILMTIITHRLVWILKPEELVLVGKYIYIGRIGIFIIASFIGLYINKIYVDKAKENQDQMAFQKMNSDISFDFVTTNQQNFAEKIDRLLHRIGEFFQVDRSYFIAINSDERTMICLNEWCNVGINSEIEMMKEMPKEKFYKWFDELENNKSILTVPVMSEGKIRGLIGMDSVKLYKKWSEENVKRLKIMANLLANGLAQVNADKEIEFMAYYDHLTKLPNRFLFKDRVNQAIQLAKESSKYIAIVLIDIDNFKSINDTMGHESGDCLLKEVGESFLKQIYETDTVARFGGDEFIILLGNIEDLKDVEEIVAKVMHLFLKSFNINDQEFFITASAGVSLYPADGDSADSLMKNADIAMYEAKSMGKNQHALCTRDMKEKIEKNVALSNDLYRALEKNELVVYYQAQIDLSTGKIAGMEALVRWMHPTRGMISPLEFIPLAEKYNLINSIGEWILKTASAQTKKWQDMGLGDTTIAVNLSAVQFINPRLAENVESILMETGLDPEYLELEITESIAIKGQNNALDILNKLKKIGIAIAIDDFGTEYSSLSRLKMLPIDRIKIDIQFIQGIQNNEKDRAITMVIINLAKHLGLNVLAEGVETAHQLEFLNQNKCDYVQGYYYHEPLTVEEMEKVLLSRI